MRHFSIWSMRFLKFAERSGITTRCTGVAGAIAAQLESLRRNPVNSIVEASQ